MNGLRECDTKRQIPQKTLPSKFLELPSHFSRALREAKVKFPLPLLPSRSFFGFRIDLGASGVFLCMFYYHTEQYKALAGASLTLLGGKALFPSIAKSS